MKKVLKFGHVLLDGETFIARAPMQAISRCAKNSPSGKVEGFVIYHPQDWQEGYMITTKTEDEAVQDFNSFMAVHKGVAA